MTFQLSTQLSPDHELRTYRSRSEGNKWIDDERQDRRCWLTERFHMIFFSSRRMNDLELKSSCKQTHQMSETQFRLVRSMSWRTRSATIARFTTWKHLLSVIDRPEFQWQMKFFVWHLILLSFSFLFIYLRPDLTWSALLCSYLNPFIQTIFSLFFPRGQRHLSIGGSRSRTCKSQVILLFSGALPSWFIQILFNVRWKMK